MKRIAGALAAVTLALQPAVSWADVSTEGLTKAQAAQLEAQRAQLVAQNAEKNVVVPPKPTGTAETVNEWIQVGQGVGAGLASAARELGIVANEFAQTPVGQITIALIIFKVAGGDLIQLFIGLLWYFTLVPIWFFFFRKLWQTKTTIVVDPASKIKTITKIPPNLGDSDLGSYTALYWLILGAILVAGIPIIFA